MNIPSPFQQRPAGGVDSKSMLPGGAAPIKVGAQPETDSLAPTPAPAPLAPPVQLAPRAPTPAPNTGAPAAPAAPAQQMVPAYVAKAMQKQQEKQAADHTLVPAPTAATPAAPTQPAPPERTSAPVPPAATGAATAVATETTPPAETPEQIAARANSMKTVEVQHNPDGSVKTDASGQPVAAADQYAPPPDATPDQVTQLSSAAATQQALMEQAKQWLTAKEDPAFVRQFNQTLLDTAIQNQAAVDATKRAIASNPSLAGQPAGDALLGLKAIQLGMNLSDLKATVSVEHAKVVADLNKKGFDAVYKLNQDNLTQDDKDIETYGAVIDRMISAGASEADLQAYFNKTIKPLLGEKDISFDQFRSPAERQKLLSTVQDDGLAEMRTALDRGDTAGALDALEAAYAPAKQVELGTALIANNDVATINQWLKDAGYDAITSAADLIGREDDVFVAQQISQAKKKIAENPSQPKIDALLKVLQGRGMDITDPDVIDAVQEYIYQQDFGDPEKPNVLPWDSDATSWKYKDWEIFNPATGATVDKGGEFYDPRDNPEPAPGSAAYQWRTTLDGAWQKYLSANPDSKSRLSRDDWFAQFKKDYTDYTKKDPSGSLDAFLNGGKTTATGGDVTSSSFSRYETKTPVVTTTTEGWKPGQVDTPPEDLPATVDAGAKKIKKESDVTKINFEDPDVKAYLNDLPATLPAQIGNPSTFAKANLGNWIKVGDKVYRVDQGIQGQYGSSDRHRDVMKLTQKDGTVVYMRPDGKFTTTPPPPQSAEHAFKTWYDEIGV